MPTPAIEVVASVAREIAAAEKPNQALHAVLVALRTELGASGVALVRMERARIVPVQSLGVRLTQRQLDEAELEQAGVFPLVLGGRVEGALIVRGIERDELADTMASLAPLLELAAAALRNARMAEEHDRLAAIMWSADDAVIGTQLDGTITSWNPGAERLYGYTAEQIVGRSASVLVPGERTAGLRGLLKRVQHGERIQHFETVLRSRDGDPVDVSLSVAAVERAPGDVVGVAFVGREISAWKRVLQAHQLLAQASATFTSTLDYEATLNVVPRAFAPAFASYCVFDVLEANEPPRSLGCADGHAGREATLRILLQERTGTLAATGPFAEVMRTGKVVLVPHVTDAWLAAPTRTPQELALITHLDAHSLLIAPVRAGERTIGVLTLAATDPHRAYDSIDVPLVQELAQRAARAVENARLYREA